MTWVCQQTFSYLRFLCKLTIVGYYCLQNNFPIHAYTQAHYIFSGMNLEWNRVLRAVNTRINQIEIDRYTYVKLCNINWLESSSIYFGFNPFATLYGSHLEYGWMDGRMMPSKWSLLNTPYMRTTTDANHVQQTMALVRVAKGLKALKEVFS